MGVAKPKGWGAIFLLLSISVPATSREPADCIGIHYMESINATRKVKNQKPLQWDFTEETLKISEAIFLTQRIPYLMPLDDGTDGTEFVEFHVGPEFEISQSQQCSPGLPNNVDLANKILGKRSVLSNSLDNCGRESLQSYIKAYCTAKRKLAKALDVPTKDDWIAFKYPELKVSDDVLQIAPNPHSESAPISYATTPGEISAKLTPPTTPGKSPAEPAPPKPPGASSAQSMSSTTSGKSPAELSPPPSTTTDTKASGKNEESIPRTVCGPEPYLYYPSSKLGKGAGRDVYVGANIYSAEPVAFKWDKINIDSGLSNEYKFYKAIGIQAGFPRCHSYYNNCQNRRTIIVDALRVPMNTYVAASGGSLSLNTIILIGLQLIDRIQILHSLNILHLDLKPENILFGFDGSLNIIDFGTAQNFKEYDPKLRSWKPRILSNLVTGTIIYHSYDMTAQLPLGRKADLETMMYILLAFYRGDLMWNATLGGGFTKARIVEQEELAPSENSQRLIHMEPIAGPTTLKGLCHGFDELHHILKYIYTLEPAQQPDYAGIKRVLHDAYIRNGFEYNQTMDLLPRKNIILDSDLTHLAVGFRSSNEIVEDSVNKPRQQKRHVAVIKFSKYYTFMFRELKRRREKLYPQESPLVLDDFLMFQASEFLTHGVEGKVETQESYLAYVRSFSVSSDATQPEFVNVLIQILQDISQQTAKSFTRVGFAWEPMKKISIVMTDDSILRAIQDLNFKNLPILTDSKLMECANEHGKKMIEVASSKEKRQETANGMTTMEIHAVRIKSSKGIWRALQSTLNGIDKTQLSVEIKQNLDRGLFTKFGFAAIHNADEYYVVCIFEYYFARAFQFLNGRRDTMPLNLKAEALFLQNEPWFVARTNVVPEKSLDDLTYELAKGLWSSREDTAKDELLSRANYDVCFRIRTGKTEIHFGKYDCKSLLITINEVRKQQIRKLKPQWDIILTPTRSLINEAHSNAFHEARKIRLPNSIPECIIDLTKYSLSEWITTQMDTVNKIGSTMYMNGDVTEMAFGWAVTLRDPNFAYFSIRCRYFYDNVLNFLNKARERHGLLPLVIHEDHYKIRMSWRKHLNMESANVWAEIPLPVNTKITGTLIGAGILSYIAGIITAVDDTKTTNARDQFLNPDVNKVLFVVSRTENNTWRFSIVLISFERNLKILPLLYCTPTTEIRDPPYALSGAIHIPEEGTPSEEDAKLVPEYVPPLVSDAPQLPKLNVEYDTSSGADFITFRNVSPKDAATLSSSPARFITPTQNIPPVLSTSSKNVKLPVTTSTASVKGKQSYDLKTPTPKSTVGTTGVVAEAKDKQLSSKPEEAKNLKKSNIPVVSDKSSKTIDIQNATSKPNPWFNRNVRETLFPEK